MGHRHERLRLDALLERAGERGAARAALERAWRGDGAMLAFEASAGLGKTSLLRAAMADAEQLGFRVLGARGVALEQELPFGVVGQLLAPALLSAPVAERAELLRGPASLAGPVLGLGDGDAPAYAVSAALHGLHWLCVNLEQRGPLMLAVDDAHWADEPSMRFLAYLAHRLGGRRLLLALAARPAEPGSGRPPLNQLLADHRMEILRPRPLSPQGVEKVVGDRVEQTASPEFCEACATASGGNPYLLDELLGELLAEGVQPTPGSAALVARMAPRSVGRHVVLRLGRLPEELARLAQAVAVFAEGAEFRHLGPLAGLSDDAVARGADLLAEYAILAPGRPLSFLHPVMRNALYAELPAAARSQLHLGAARLLRAEGAGPRRLGPHLLATQPGSDDETFDELLAAAAETLCLGAPQAALRYLDRAVDEPVAKASAAQALHRRGAVRLLLGDRRAAGDLRAAAAATPDGVARAAVLRDLARAEAIGLRDAEAAVLLDRAIELSGDGASDLRDSCAIDRTWVLFSRDDLAPRFVDEMRRPGRAYDPAGLPGLTSATIAGHWRAIQCTSAEQARTQALGGLHEAAFAAPGFDGLAAVTYGSIALCLADAPADALTAVCRLLDGHRAAGNAHGLSWLHLLAGMARMHVGDLPDAERELAAVLGHVQGDASQDAAGALALACLAAVALERHGTAEAYGWLDRMQPGPTIAGMMLRAAHGRAELADGRAAAAFADLRAARDSARARGLRNNHYLFPWGSDVALAALALDERELALELAERDLLLARRFGARSSLGDALRVAGVVRGGDAGLALLREAAATLAPSPARLLHARTLLDLGSALRRANQRAAAREPLRLAIDLARRCGADVLAGEAIEELRATGGRLRRQYVFGVEALTPAQRRVAYAAASGLTNREIARRLFVSINTVETHMGAVLSTLDIRSRRELRDTLDRTIAVS